MVRAEVGARKKRRSDAGDSFTATNGQAPVPPPTLRMGNHTAMLEERVIDSAFHEFRVDYEQAKNLTIGQSISNAFSAGGYMWRVLAGNAMMVSIKDIPILKGDNYNEWYKKLDFFFIMAELDWVLTAPVPIDPERPVRGGGMKCDRCCLDRLKLICAQKLCDDMSVDTVAATLVCAETYSCPELKSKCIDFFAAEDNFKRAVLTKGFVELGQMFPSIIDELRERIGL